MGQYWKPVNLDKREFINPHKLGTGLQLWEQLANHPGTAGAMIVLTAAMPEARGSGDFDHEGNSRDSARKEDYLAIAARTIGRWAGDRIAIVGDYAEDEDLAPEHRASLIYSLCNSQSDIYEFADYMQKRSEETDNEELKLKFAEQAQFLRDSTPFTDITDDVCAVIEHELNGEFQGDGWRDFVRLGER